MPWIANVLFHNTPCCGAQFSVEYPRDMQPDEEWVDEVVCKSCQVRYRLVLSEFKKGSPKKARWYEGREHKNLENAAG